jgi:hypothetical protein
MPHQDNTPQKIENLSDLLSSESLTLLSASGNALVEEIGVDVVRGVVLDVLSGENLRDATEILTRRRIAALNLAMVNLFLRGLAVSEDFIQQLPLVAAESLARGRLSKSERWLSYWVLGLTHKAFQNVLRNDPERIVEYRDQYIKTCREVIESHSRKYGELRGHIELSSGLKAEVNWLLLTHLLNTVGSETLAIRGSEKSAYGKLFEKLVLGSLLHSLGFKYTPGNEVRDYRNTFWFSSQGQKRESDATLLYQPGKAVRFDIGFIGRGNTEISLDKVSRFERFLELDDQHWYMSTIIIVDTIGPRSNIVELAKEIDGYIVQMSGAYWPKQVARELNRRLGFKHPLLNMEHSEISDFLKRAISDAPLEKFIGLEANGNDEDDFSEE